MRPAGVSAMPIFEYVCKECDHQFEALVYGSDKASCPKCQSKRLAPQLSVFAVAAKGPRIRAPLQPREPAAIAAIPAAPALARCQIWTNRDLDGQSPIYPLPFLPVWSGLYPASLRQPFLLPLL